MLPPDYDSWYAPLLAQGVTDMPDSFGDGEIRKENWSWRFAPIAEAKSRNQRNFVQQCGARLYAVRPRAGGTGRVCVYGKYSAFAGAVRRAERGSARGKSERKKSKSTAGHRNYRGSSGAGRRALGLIEERCLLPYRQSESVDPPLEYHCTDLVLERRLVWLVDNRTGTGAHKDHANSWWVACARIDLGSDGSGTLTLWDDSCAAGQIIADAQVQADSDLTTSGRLVSTDGSFLTAR